MNITCTNCSARYALPEEKVRGKKFKFPCKKCGNAILVDGTQPESATAAAPEVAPVGAAAELTLGIPEVASKEAPAAAAPKAEPAPAPVVAAAKATPVEPAAKAATPVEPAAKATPVEPAAKATPKAEQPAAEVEPPKASPVAAPKAAPAATAKAAPELAPVTPAPTTPAPATPAPATTAPVTVVATPAKAVTTTPKPVAKVEPVRTPATSAPTPADTAKPAAATSVPAEKPKAAEGRTPAATQPAVPKTVAKSGTTPQPAAVAAKVETPKVEPPKLETPKVEPAKVEPPKLEPVAPVRASAFTEPGKVETPKARPPNAMRATMVGGLQAPAPLPVGDPNEPRRAVVAVGGPSAPSVGKIVEIAGPPKLPTRGERLRGPARTPRSPDADDKTTKVRWFVAINDVDPTEMSTAQLLQLFTIGTVNEKTYVWASGMPDWEMAKDVPLLSDTLRAAGLNVARSFEDDSDEHTVMVGAVKDPPAPAVSAERSTSESAVQWHEPGSWSERPPRPVAESQYDDVTVTVNPDELMRQAEDATAGRKTIPGGSSQPDIDALLAGVLPHPPPESSSEAPTVPRELLGPPVERGGAAARELNLPGRSLPMPVEARPAPQPPVMPAQALQPGVGTASVASDDLTGDTLLTERRKQKSGSSLWMVPVVGVVIVAGAVTGVAVSPDLLKSIGLGPTAAPKPSSTGKATAGTAVTAPERPATAPSAGGATAPDASGASSAGTAASAVAAPSAGAAPSAVASAAPAASAASTGSADIDAAIAATKERAKRCIPDGKPGGLVKIKLILLPNGKVSNPLFMHGPLAPTVMGVCVREEFLKMQVAPFTGKARVFDFELSLP